MFLADLKDGLRQINIFGCCDRQAHSGAIDEAVSQIRKHPDSAMLHNRIVVRVYTSELDGSAVYEESYDRIGFTGKGTVIFSISRVDGYQGPLNENAIRFLLAAKNFPPVSLQFGIVSMQLNNLCDVLKRREAYIECLIKLNDVLNNVLSEKGELYV